MLKQFSGLRHSISIFLQSISIFFAYPSLFTLQLPRLVLLNTAACSVTDRLACPYRTSTFYWTPKPNS